MIVFTTDIITGVIFSKLRNWTVACRRRWQKCYERNKEASARCCLPRHWAFRSFLPWLADVLADKLSRQSKQPVGGRHTYTVWHSVSECLDSVEAKKNNPSFLFCNGRFSRAHGAIHSMCIIWDPVAIVSRLHVRYCPVYTARLGKPALHKMVNAVSHKSSVHSTREGPQLLSINISHFSPNIK